MPLLSVDRLHTTSVIKVTESQRYRSKPQGPATYSVPIKLPGKKYVYNY